MGGYLSKFKRSFENTVLVFVVKDWHAINNLLYSGQNVKHYAFRELKNDNLS